MEKIEIKICCGTMCHIMGGSQLLLLEKSLSDDMLEIVNIKASNCLDLCNDSDKGGAPYVLVDGSIVKKATIEKVVSAIKEIISYDNFNQ